MLHLFFDMKGRSIWVPGEVFALSLSQTGQFRVLFQSSAAAYNESELTRDTVYDLRLR
ncbi:MAG: hypothetical protein NVS4B8_05000 [Herpetosiphon sp.]